MERLHDLANQKIYHDNTTDIYLIAARRYSFWMLHERYPENQAFKRDILAEMAKADEAIRQFEEDKQVKIREVIELYEWKDTHYGYLK